MMDGLISAAVIAIWARCQDIWFNRCSSKKLCTLHCTSVQLNRTSIRHWKSYWASGSHNCSQLRKLLNTAWLCKKPYCSDIPIRSAEQMLDNTYTSFWSLGVPKCYLTYPVNSISLLSWYRNKAFFKQTSSNEITKQSPHPTLAFSCLECPVCTILSNIWYIIHIHSEHRITMQKQRVCKVIYWHNSIGMHGISQENK